MSRTHRKQNRRVFGGSTKEDAKREYLESRRLRGEDSGWTQFTHRNWLLHGTDAKNYKYKNHLYFNRAHRIGRASARDQLRPHKVLEDDFDFNPARYQHKLRGVWWDIY